MTTSIEKCSKGTGSERSLRTFSESADATASGQSSSFDTAALEDASWIAGLTTLAGGTAPTVTVQWEHSYDGVSWYAVAAEAPLAAAGFKQRLTRENLMRYLRVSWTTTGSPTTATLEIRIQVHG